MPCNEKCSVPAMIHIIYEICNKTEKCSECLFSKMYDLECIKNQDIEHINPFDILK